VAGNNSYVGQLMLFAGTFAPLDWALCDGRLLAISQNDTLYALIGTTFGGDGNTTFALPDLRGRVAVGAGTGPGLSPYVLGERAGTEAVTLTQGQLPAHSHTASGSSSNQNSSVPNNNLLAGGPTVYTNDNIADSTMALASLTAAAGSGLPHNNVKPYLALNWCICLFGIFPSQ
jgi:microcystin-dependent protein